METSDVRKKVENWDVYLKSQLKHQIRAASTLGEIMFFPAEAYNF